MPDFRFFFASGNARSREVVFDLPDTSVVGTVAKHYARQYAACDLGSGHLRLLQDVAVFDSEGVEVARYKLSEFLCVE